MRQKVHPWMSLHCLKRQASERSRHCFQQYQQLHESLIDRESTSSLSLHMDPVHTCSCSIHTLSRREREDFSFPFCACPFMPGPQLVFHSITSSPLSILESDSMLTAEDIVNVPWLLIWVLLPSAVALASLATVRVPRSQSTNPLIMLNSEAEYLVSMIVGFSGIFATQVARLNGNPTYDKVCGTLMIFAFGLTSTATSKRYFNEIALQAIQVVSNCCAAVYLSRLWAYQEDKRTEKKGKIMTILVPQTQCSPPRRYARPKSVRQIRVVAESRQ